MVVGAILIAIIHGDTLLTGSADRSTWVKAGFTPLVPYVISTPSSVGAMRTRVRRSAE